MNPFVLLLLVLFLSFGTAPGQAKENHSPDNEPRELALAWFDPHHLLPRGVETMTEEVDAIFRSIGIEVRWNSSTSQYMDRSPGELLVVLIPGGPVGWGNERHVMGATVPGPDPIIRIYFGNVARTLGIRLDPQGPIPPGKDSVEMARALARVLGHEVIHAIAPPHPHADSGVFDHRLTYRDLTARRLNLDPNCSTAFLKAFLALRKSKPLSRM